MHSRGETFKGVLVVALLVALVVVVVVAPHARWLQLSLIVPFVALIVTALRKPGTRVSIGNWDTPPEKSYRAARLMGMNPPKPPPGHRGRLEWTLPEPGEEPVLIPQDPRALEWLHLRFYPLVMLVFQIVLAVLFCLVFPAGLFRFAGVGFAVFLMVVTFSRMLTPPRWADDRPGTD